MSLLKRHKIVAAQGVVRRTYGTYTRAGEMVGEAQLCTVNVSHDLRAPLLPHLGYPPRDKNLSLLQVPVRLHLPPGFLLSAAVYTYAA